MFPCLLLFYRSPLGRWEPALHPAVWVASHVRKAVRGRFWGFSTVTRVICLSPALLPTVARVTRTLLVPGCVSLGGAVSAGTPVPLRSTAPSSPAPLATLEAVSEAAVCPAPSPLLTGRLTSFCAS